MENNKLTEEQLKEITDVLSENASEQTKMLRQIKEESADQSYPTNVVNKGELIKSVEYVSVSEETLERSVSSPEVKANSSITIDRLVGGKEEVSEEEFINDKDYIETANSLDMGLSDEDVTSLLKLMYKLQADDKTKVYSHLPDKMQEFCRQLVSMQLESMNASGRTTPIKELNTLLEKTAKDTMKMFIGEMEKDKGYNDLQKSLEQELKIPGLIDMYNDYQYDLMYTKLLEKADLIEEKFPEKAHTLRAISKAYLDSVNFDTLTKLAESNSKEARHLDKDVKKYARFCREFNYKYNTTDLIIKDCSLMSLSLARVLPQTYSEDNIKKFIIFFCKAVANMKPSNLIEHTFMYYTVSTIISLDRLKADNKFFEDSVNKISHIIDLL